MATAPDGANTWKELGGLYNYACGITSRGNLYCFGDMCEPDVARQGSEMAAVIKDAMLDARAKGCRVQCTCRVGNSGLTF